MKRRWLLLSAVLLWGGISAYALAAHASEAAALRGDVARIRGSIARIDAFLAADHPDPFENAAIARAADPPAAPERDEGWLASYEAPEGYAIRSDSAHWDADMLRALDEELKRNRHGEELYALHEVRVMAAADDTAAADHRTESVAVPFTMAHPALPDGLCVNLSQYGSVITLYDGDARTTIASMARSLSHEYGHLFTRYHMLQTPAQHVAGRYVQLRRLPDEARALILDRADYRANHRWYIDEIAAEDYVLLLGSPTTRQRAEYTDVRQQLSQGQAERKLDPGASNAMNLCPHENMAIPLPADVPGLAAYFYECLGSTPPPPAVEERPIELRIQGYDVGYDLVGGYRTFEHFRITWTTPYPEGAFYTLICCDEGDGTPIPIKTVAPGQKASATIGTVTSERGSRVRIMSDSLDRGTKVFFVTALLPDGTLYVSDGLTYAFD